MSISPPENQNDYYKDEPDQADPSRRLMSHRCGAVQLVTDQIPDRHDHRAPYDRTQHVPSEELKERHPARTRHRTRHKSRAGDEARHEHGLAAVSLKEDLKTVVTRAHELEPRSQARQKTLTAGAANDKTAAVTGDCAQNHDDI